MDGISTRTGGEGGSRRHDPTGKLMTSVERVGPASGRVLVAPATAERPAAGAACSTRSSASAAGAPGRAGDTRLSTTRPRRTLSPLVMTYRQLYPLDRRCWTTNPVAAGRSRSAT